MNDRGAGAAAARAAAVSAPPVIPLSGWGGDAVIPRAAPEFGAVDVAFVHHTVTAIDYAASESGRDRLPGHVHRTWRRPARRWTS